MVNVAYDSRVISVYYINLKTLFSFALIKEVYQSCCIRPPGKR